jgi:hypothetical protein
VAHLSDELFGGSYVGWIVRACKHAIKSATDGLPSSRRFYDRPPEAVVRLDARKTARSNVCAVGG